MDFKLAEGNDENRMFSKTWEGKSGQKENCFSLKGRRKERKGIISTFFLGLHTCDPAARLPNCVCVCFYVCQSHSLYD